MSAAASAPGVVSLALLAAGTAALSCALIVVLRPLLVRYALARPNARSGHRIPTPQGGGIAVLGATLAGCAVAAALGWLPQGAIPVLAQVLLAAVILGVIGTIDDIRPLPVLPRLIGQAAAVALALQAGGDEVRLLPQVPLLVERALEVFAGLWFVNLTNFMDGLDWMTVAEVVPLTLVLGLLAVFGPLSSSFAGSFSSPASPGTGVVAAALLGGMLGFAPSNKPRASLFLGDVGSLPIGLLLAWLLFQLAASGAVVAALLLPLYYCLDATITLVRRLARGGRFWEAHREHFYQQAADRGVPALTITATVAALNGVLALLALLSLAWPTWPVQILLLAAGTGIVGLVLGRFAGRL